MKRNIPYMMNATQVMASLEEVWLSKYRDGRGL